MGMEGWGNGCGELEIKVLLLLLCSSYHVRNIPYMLLLVYFNCILNKKMFRWTRFIVILVRARVTPTSSFQITSISDGVEVVMYIFFNHLTC